MSYSLLPVHAGDMSDSLALKDHRVAQFADGMVTLTVCLTVTHGTNHAGLSDSLVVLLLFYCMYTVAGPNRQIEAQKTLSYSMLTVCHTVSPGLVSRWHCLPSRGG